MKLSSFDRRLLVGSWLIAAVAFCVSLALPCLLFDEGGPYSGLGLFLCGPLGPLCGSFAWYAHPLMVAAFIVSMVKQDERGIWISMGLSGLSLCVAWSALYLKEILRDEAGNMSHIIGYGPGFYLWLASFVLPTITIAGLCILPAIRRSPKLLLISLFLAVGFCASFDVAAATAADTVPVVGPAHGTLYAHGGGRVLREHWRTFLDLAGGAEKEIIVIPSAGTEEQYDDTWDGLKGLRAAGATQLTVLHTRSRDEADSDDFVVPLQTAHGVWIAGGRQWRLADLFLGTRTLLELQRVLERGGVIGGSSAGATILGSYLVRGSPETNRTVMAPGHEQGFGFLKHVAIDQHCIARGREADLLPVVHAHPELLGFGLDESAALIVRGDRATVQGPGRVVVTGAKEPPNKDVGKDQTNSIDASPGNESAKPYIILDPDEEFDLRTRQRIRQ